MTFFMGMLRLTGGLLAFCFMLSGILALIGTFFFFTLVPELPQIPDPLSRIIERPPTEIFDANGESIMKIGGRDFVSLDQISFYLVQAILATEDHRFRQHEGINKLRTIKALSVTLFSKGRVQGASTITQQLAKNLFFTFEQTLSRKIRELLVAFQIEAQFSKNEILEAYINQIYFGPQAQGIGAAADALFGKSSSELNLAESALLAGLPKSPSRYNPLRYFDRAKKRQRIVLNRMLTVGFISEDEAVAAQSAELKFKGKSQARKAAGYFVDWILKDLEVRYGPQLVYHGGLKVTTTLDMQMQLEAENAIRDGVVKVEKMMANPVLDKNQRLEKLQGALVAVQTTSGAVKAMVGGRDYTETEFNRATKCNRLPGSGFKPFLYYTAFEKNGLTPASVITDQLVSIPLQGTRNWQPKNFDRKYRGPVILKTAFSHSINTVAAQLITQTGPEAVMQTAKRCGIESPLIPVYSLALGTSGVSPLEMASSFGVFATGGLRYKPFGIWRVEDAFGQVLEENIISSSRVLDSRLAFQIVDMMQAVIDEGTGRRIRKIGFRKPAAGKTGTTNRYHDAWFTGFTPTLSTSVWVGFDGGGIGLKDNYRRGITGGRGAAPIWAKFMRVATEEDPARPFLQPSGMSMETVNIFSGQPVAPGDVDSVRVPLKKTSVFPFFNRFKTQP
ncbi:MAG: PBP1A family penicillin-binding protein [Desulfobacteraceae bacterium]|nr:PBP1A family penicillin-binding protein [Desulfobacteraceae bacterium]